MKKVAVISGGFGYVGFEVARALAQSGFTIVCLYQNTVKDLSQLNGEGHHMYKCNLEHHSEVENVFRKINEEIGGVDILVHTAAKKPERKKLLQTNQEAFMEQLRGTTLTAFNFLCIGGKYMKDEGCVIGLTTIGIAEEYETSSLGGYIPAKYGVQGILTLLKQELPRIHVYAIAPGFMEGGMNQDIPQAFKDIVKAKRGKLATPALIAETILDIYTNPSLYKDRFTIPLAPEYSTE